MTNDDERDDWSLPPERGAAAVVEEIESSGASYAAPGPGGNAAFEPGDTALMRDDAQGASASLPATIGPCRVEALLGTGGMAEVFLAEWRSPSGVAESVVVKRMLPHLARDQAFVKMFLREAEIAACVAHEHVVRLLSSGEDDGTHYLVLEHVDGLTLHRLAKRAWRGRVPVPLELIARAIADAARGLAHAHGALSPSGAPLGLVHRDVSPDNLILSRDGVTKVLDFGIAKGQQSASLTRTGEIKGKLPFMAPEQIQGGAIDHRTDLYGLGVTLYWLLAGTRPFRGDSDMRLMQGILMEHPAPPSAINSAVPQEIDELVLALLAKDPAERPAGGDDVARALEPFAGRGREVARAFVAQMLEAPPSPESDPGLSGPFRAASPGTDKRSDTFSAHVRELAKGATPAFGVSPIDNVAPLPDEEQLRAEIVGRPTGWIAAGVVVVVVVLALAAWLLLS